MPFVTHRTPPDGRSLPYDRHEHDVARCTTFSACREVAVSPGNGSTTEVCREWGGSCDGKGSAPPGTAQGGGRATLHRRRGAARWSGRIKGSGYGYAAGFGLSCSKLHAKDR